MKRLVSSPKKRGAALHNYKASSNKWNGGYSNIKIRQIELHNYKASSNKWNLISRTGTADKPALHNYKASSNKWNFRLLIRAAAPPDCTIIRLHQTSETTVSSAEIHSLKLHNYKASSNKWNDGEFFTRRKFSENCTIIRLHQTSETIRLKGRCPGRSKLHNYKASSNKWNTKQRTLFRK